MSPSDNSESIVGLNVGKAVGGRVGRTLGLKEGRGVGNLDGVDDGFGVGEVVGGPHSRSFPGRKL